MATPGYGLTREYDGTEQGCHLCHTRGVVGVDLVVVKLRPDPLHQADEPSFIVGFRCRDQKGCRRRVQSGP